MLEEIGGEADETILVGPDTTGIRPRRVSGQLPQDECRVLEGLAFDEPREEQVTLLPQAELVVEVDLRVVRKQATGLQLDQRCRNQEELGSDPQVEAIHALELDQVGIDDLREVDLVEVNFLAQDEMEQQIKGPVEHGRVHLVRHRRDPRPQMHARNASRLVRFAPMTRVFSGIQPTGELHLGNYLGAIRNWARIQHEADAIFCVVDLHSITIPQEPGAIGSASLHVSQMLIAAGLDPELCTLFVQSHVREHTECAWLMECNVSFGELSRMTQFKDKSDRQQFISTGLFTYPALQAADILLYDTNEVPVGADQRQHVEITRDIAERFNSRYGDTFTLPAAVVPRVGGRVMDLQRPGDKMSKSVDSPKGTVGLLDDPKQIEKKLKSAVTDNDGEVRFDPEGKPGVSNLLSILGAATDRDPASLADDYDQYGPLKTDTAEAVMEFLVPLQARFAELQADPGETSRLLKVGADKAREMAVPTLERAKANIGLLAD